LRRTLVQMKVSQQSQGVGKSEKIFLNAVISLTFGFADFRTKKHKSATQEKLNRCTEVWFIKNIFVQHVSNNLYMNDQLSQVITSIKSNAALLPAKKVTAGFDGFADTIVRIIKNKDAANSNELFTTIKDFGAYISEKAGGSFSLELEEISMKLGGNMPITANAVARLGAKVNCIGALGHPQLHKVFDELAVTCNCYSFAEPGTATAYEFNDGKIMLSQMRALNELKWDAIKKIIAADTFIKLYDESDLLCLLNWSEIDASTNIWKGILNDVMPFCKGEREKRTIFIDLSDCSKRTNNVINEMLGLIKLFRTYAKVILSLNNNESRCICEVLFGKDVRYDFETAGSKIFEQLAIDTLLLHSSKKAITFSARGRFEADSFFVGSPVISTGAGDNFNAGFVAAQLMNLDITSSLIFANAVAALYIQSGISPQVNDVIQFLESKKTN
jgi:sugar/nucleoside kinase (ribokinase family)